MPVSGVLRQVAGRSITSAREELEALKKMIAESQWRSVYYLGTQSSLAQNAVLRNASLRAKETRKRKAATLPPQPQFRQVGGW